MKDSNKTTARYIMGIVALVAAVALIHSFLSYLHDAKTADLAGQAVAADASLKWTSCLDQGNKIKLSNDQDSLVKSDVCLPDEAITRVSCVEDDFGYFNYKYAAEQSCSKGKFCKEDSSGAGYCA